MNQRSECEENVSNSRSFQDYLEEEKEEGKKTKQNKEKKKELINE